MDAKERELQELFKRARLVLSFEDLPAPGSTRSRHAGGYR